jgi:hypothetical protein
MQDSSPDDFPLTINIGPNELSVNHPDAIYPIYLNLSRASFYRGAAINLLLQVLRENLIRFQVFQRLPTLSSPSLTGRNIPKDAEYVSFPQEYPLCYA